MTSGLNKKKIQVVTNTNIYLQTIRDNKTSGDTLGAKKKKKSSTMVSSSKSKISL